MAKTESSFRYIDIRWLNIPFLEFFAPLIVCPAYLVQEFDGKGLNRCLIMYFLDPLHLQPFLVFKYYHCIHNHAVITHQSAQTARPKLKFEYS